MNEGQQVLEAAHALENGRAGEEALGNDELHLLINLPRVNGLRHNFFPRVVDHTEKGQPGVRGCSASCKAWCAAAFVLRCERVKDALLEDVEFLVRECPDAVEEDVGDLHKVWPTPLPVVAELWDGDEANQVPDTGAAVGECVCD